MTEDESHVPDESPPPLTVAVRTRVAKFCGQCGEPLEKIGGICRSCLPGRGTPDPYAHRAAQGAPGHGAALLLYGMMLVSFVPLFFADEDRVIRLQFGVQMFDTIVVLLFVAILWRHVSPCLKRVDLGWCLKAVPLGVGTFLVASVWVTLMTSIFQLEEFEYIRPTFDAGFGWTAVILSVMVQPAIIEELAFRGVVLKSLGRMMSTREAIIVSAAMFMILHLTFLAFPYLFMMGLLLGWMRLKSGSIWPCIILHAVHNGLVIAWENYSMPI